jgi:hypothetical protein
MKLILIITLTASLFSCAPSAYRPGPNPLDAPGGEPTASELHAQNLKAITSNPAYR